MLFSLMLCLALDSALTTDAVVGTWKGAIYLGSTPIKATLVLQMEDGKLKGTLHYDELNQPSRTLQCKLKGDKLKIFANKAPSRTMPFQMFFDGAVTGNIYRGKIRQASASSKPARSDPFHFKRVLTSTGAASD